MHRPAGETWRSQKILMEHEMIEEKTDNAQIAVRCHEIQTCLANRNVPEFETIIEVGMAIRLLRPGGRP